MYQGEWFIGAIIEVYDETVDVDVSFIKQDKTSFVWPQRENKCWVPKKIIFLHYVPMVMKLYPIVFSQMNCKDYKISLVICR